jgi:hypothetical protein
MRDYGRLVSTDASIELVWPLLRGLSRATIGKGGACSAILPAMPDLTKLRENSFVLGPGVPMPALLLRH